MKVVLSREARADLVGIGDYIAIDNPARARRLVRMLREAAEQIGEMPNAFPLVPRYEHLGIRRRTLGNYLVFYRIDADFIAITNIVHGARDYAQLLESSIGRSGPSQG